MRPERAYSPAARASDAPDPSRVLVIGCGALARELVAVIDQAGLANVDLTCLPATLHNRPGGIPAAVRAKIRAARPRYQRIFIAYADCGTGGLLDTVLRDEGVERLPGAHCYEFYSGSHAFEAMTDEDPATFFLTDFLTRNFDRLVIEGLGLDRHPELLPAYFGNYHRLVYLAQTDDPALVTAARRAARRLGLTFETRRTGYGELATSVTAVSRSGARNHVRSRPADPRAPRGARAPSAARAPSQGLAPAASNVARRPRVQAESMDSLQSMQASNTNTPRRDGILRTMQQGGAARGGKRRSLRPTQAGIGKLQGKQGRATPAGITTAPRPTASVRPTTPRPPAPRPAPARPTPPRPSTATPAPPRSTV